MVQQCNTISKEIYSLAKVLKKVDQPNPLLSSARCSLQMSWSSRVVGFEDNTTLHLFPLHFVYIGYATIARIRISIFTIRLVLGVNNKDPFVQPHGQTAYPTWQIVLYSCQILLSLYMLLHFCMGGISSQFTLRLNNAQSMWSH
jgi:hypothetical protein